jgi:hypothetical protein
MNKYRIKVITSKEDYIIQERVYYFRWKDIIICDNYNEAKEKLKELNTPENIRYLYE